MGYLGQMIGAIFLGISTVAAHGHEFWIDPEQFEIEKGGNVVAAIRVGELYKGSSYAFVPARFQLFDLIQGDMRGPVQARIGDRPALNMRINEEGLLTVLYVSTDSTVTYDDPDKFVSFTTHKDAEWVLEEHARRGLPEAGFTEIYSRHAKALIAVGEGAGQDAARGLLTEIVALKNPYLDDLSEGMPVRVFYQGEPRKQAQVEIFARRDGEVLAPVTVRTDEDGRAVIPVTPGTQYLLDSVVLRVPAPDIAKATGAVWESLWASLVFGVPAE
ncbi:DUF4198 domain-containing protein [Profundibacterium mesophilum]|uniref:DUF4198 domain-containing protein n=1 Tax=Profundibacterium mesophilum KAUST100406-0324 TaxID=1037889 RepID=A0A921TE62_9RHOB|nr:DUF4198 domain-containing protein [Profundibacterium mesophilum]KAF0676977.1 hypothetical protein PMES_00774 [Profundibacterium mesophilum KAUST100406-0324]